MYCRNCHYDLSHTANERCPECGRTFDRKCAETFLSDVSGLAEAKRSVRHVCLFRGVLIPLAMFAYGAGCLVTQTSSLPGLAFGIGARMTPLYGAPAIAMGLAWIGGAVALVGAYLLARLESHWKIAPIVVAVGVTLFILGWGSALWWIAAAVFA